MAAVIAGAGLGWLIDRWLGISPWGMMVFLLLGFAVGVFNAMRAAGVVWYISPDPVVTIIEIGQERRRGRPPTRHHRWQRRVRRESQSRTLLIEKRAMSKSRDNKPQVLLITGVPGIGKTTVIRRAADGLRDKGVRGFYTEEVREKGERRGFRLVSFDGTAHIIAHVDFSKSPRVGKYGVDVQALDNAAVLLKPDPKARVYIVDEIGKMECLSEGFVAAMRILLAGNTPIVATVGAHGSGFIAEVKRRPECVAI